MTIKEYIAGKFGGFGIDLSDADFSAMLLSYHALSDDTLLDENNINLCNMAICDFIPSLLVRPTISESGFSMSWNIKGIKDYYSFLCDKYDIVNTISDKPTINFL